MHQGVVQSNYTQQAVRINCNDGLIIRRSIALADCRSAIENGCIAVVHQSATQLPLPSSPKKRRRAQSRRCALDCSRLVSPDGGGAGASDADGTLGKCRALNDTTTWSDFADKSIVRSKVSINNCKALLCLLCHVQ